MFIIIALLVGSLIGITINTYLNKRINELDEEKISNLEELNRFKDELIELYANSYESLEKAYNDCQSGINKTINENIELKKRLSKESS